MKDEQALTVQNLPLEYKATLSNDQKKALVKLLEDEFKRRGNVNDAVIREKKHQLLEEYRKMVGYENLVEGINNAKSALEQAKKALERVGLSEDGEIARSYNNGDWRNNLSPVARKGIKRVESLLEAVEREFDVDTHRSKIIARLWLARTYGEAIVLLRDVMGNGIIPSVKLEDIDGKKE